LLYLSPSTHFHWQSGGTGSGFAKQGCHLYYKEMGNSFAHKLSTTFFLVSKKKTHLSDSTY